MSLLSKYSKNKTPVETKIVTSINISKSHKEFIDRENLNLSRIVRDAIENLIQLESKNLKVSGE